MFLSSRENKFRKSRQDQTEKHKLKSIIPHKDGLFIAIKHTLVIDVCFNPPIKYR